MIDKGVFFLENIIIYIYRVKNRKLDLDLVVFEVDRQGSKSSSNKIFERRVRMRIDSDILELEFER